MYVKYEICKFDIHGSVHVNVFSGTYNQQDATLYNVWNWFVKHFQTLPRQRQVAVKPGKYRMLCIQF
jgi:hypothetical protein